MPTVNSNINFKSPRQREWGVVLSNYIQQYNYGGATDDSGNPINSYSTNCYEDALDHARMLISQGNATTAVQVVEFVPYDYVMTPNV